MKWLKAFPVPIESSNSDVLPKSRPKKLLDDSEALLYCGHQFDRQFAISLS